MDSIPIIDISPILIKSPSEDQIGKVAREWDRAFRTVGFAIITGHGVDSSLPNILYDKAKQFFNSDEVKLKYFKNEGYGTGGFVPMGIEAVGRTSDIILDSEKGKDGDLVESFVFRPGADDPGALPPSIRSEVEEYCSKMKEILAIIMRLRAHALKLSPDYFR